MSHSHQRHYDSGRLSYDDEREDHDRDRAYGHIYDREREPNGWRDKPDGSYSPRGRDRAYQENAPRHESRDRLSPPYRRLERSRSPYYASNDARPRRNSSRSPSPDSRHHRRTSPYARDHDRQSRRQYYDRDAPERYDNERGPYYGQPSRDIMLEGIGGDMTDHDVATLLPFAV